MNITRMLLLDIDKARVARSLKGPPNPAAFQSHPAGCEPAGPVENAGCEGLLTSGFHEFLAAAPGDEIATSALALSLAFKALGATRKSLCHCSLTCEAQEHGRLYGAGLAGLGIDASRVLMVSAPSEKDLLWTLEEAVASGVFGAIIGALGPRERLYGFTASRRLKLRAAASDASLFLLRHWASGGATAAHGRWRVSSRPSRSQGQHASYRFLGPPRLRLALERMGSLPPQHWEMEFDASCGFHLAPLLENGQDRGAGRRRRQAG